MKFQTSIALELIDLCNLAYNASPDVNGLTIRQSDLLPEDTKTFSVKKGMADTEGFTSRSARGDVVVAFRGSESRFFKKEGAFTDWALTNLSSSRITYSPAPGVWPNRRWVHRGFWHAYEVVKLEIVREVQRLIDKSSATSRRIFVTGHSLGGALAFLAALELSDVFREIPVELYSFGAPRVGDSTLNKLLTERVAASFIVGFRGDPVIHLPPLGPNFPVNFSSPITVHIGPVKYPVATPTFPSFNQHYQTADQIVYINRRDERKDHLPLGMVTFRFNDHFLDRYREAIIRSAEMTTGKTTPPRSKARRGPVLHMMLSS